MKTFNLVVIIMFGIFNPFSASAANLSVNDLAPTFKTKTQAGADFDLASRKGKWTVLFFYPKADTPGCTKQACAFRDSVDKIRALGADIYGISVNTVEAQAAFHKKYHLKFDLLADSDGKIVSQFGTKMPLLNMSKRWTFILGPDLKVRSIRKDVDPVLDAQKTAEEITRLKADAAKNSEADT